MINGLSYIHSKGYAHGDIKLNNIIVNKDFQLKIAGFGNSKKLNESHKKDYFLKKMKTS